MRAQRMLRAGLESELIASRPVQSLDEGEPESPTSSETVEQFIDRLSCALTALRSQNATSLTKEPPSYVYSASDEIAQQAANFAAALGKVTSARSSGEPDDDDASAVNAHIAMITEEAGSLIAALIVDAEARGLEASGPTMTISRVEPTADDRLHHDQKLIRSTVTYIVAG